MPRQDGEAGVVAHRQDRRLALGHRREDQHPFLLGVPEDPLQGVGIEAVVLQGVEGVANVVRLGRDPLLVRSQGGQRRLDLGPHPVAAGGQVDVDDVPRSELAGGDRVHLDLGRDPGLRRHDDVVGGDRPAGRPQSVAVQPGDEPLAVAGDDGRGSVPGFGQEGVVLVEGAQTRVEILDVLPGGGDQHLLDVRKGPSGTDENLEGFVQARRVGALGGDQRHEIGDPVAPYVAVQVVGSGLHPAPVRRHRVDLAVVGEDAEGLSQLPRRHRVRRVPLMEDREIRLESRVLQVPVERLDVRRREQPLVDDRSRRGRGDGEPLEVAPGALGVAASQEQRPFERVAPGTGLGRHDGLLDGRHRTAGGLGQGLHPDRNGPPAQQPETLASEGLADDLTAAVGIVPGQERHDDAELGAVGGGDPGGGQVPFDDPVRDPGHDARSVPGAVDRTGAAMIEAVEATDGQAKRAVRGGGVAGGDEPDAARIAYVAPVQRIAVHPGLLASRPVGPWRSCARVGDRPDGALHCISPWGYREIGAAVSPTCEGRRIPSLGPCR